MSIKKVDLVCPECGGSPTVDCVSTQPPRYEAACECGYSITLDQSPLGMFAEQKEEAMHIGPSFREIKHSENGQTEITQSAENISGKAEMVAQSVTAEQLEKKISEMLQIHGYQYTMLFSTISGVRVNPGDALRDGFKLDLVLTKAKQDNDTDA